MTASGAPLNIHIAHRVVAFLLFGHLLGMMIAVSRRREPKVIVTAARVAFGAALVQVLIAAAMIEMRFPAVSRSLHQAAGTFVWLAIVSLAIIAAHAAQVKAEPELERAAA